jgi:outer membrane protein assembly factor BamB
MTLAMTVTSAVVDVDSSGHPVMVGYVDIDPDVFAQESYLAITKVNKTTGAVTWSRKLDGQADEQAYGMAVGPTGEVVAVGYMDQLTGVDTDDRMVVVKYLSDGTIDWQRAIQFDAGWTSTGC